MTTFSAIGSYSHPHFGKNRLKQKVSTLRTFVANNATRPFPPSLGTYPTITTTARYGKQVVEIQLDTRPEASDNHQGHDLLMKIRVPNRKDVTTFYMEAPPVKPGERQIMTIGSSDTLKSVAIDAPDAVRTGLGRAAISSIITQLVTRIKRHGSLVVSAS